MNAAHLHLALNHLPVVGSFFALLLLAWGMFRRSEEIKRTALLGVVVVTAFCFPGYFSGDSAAIQRRNSLVPCLVSTSS